MEQQQMLLQWSQLQNQQGGWAGAFSCRMEAVQGQGEGFGPQVSGGSCGCWGVCVQNAGQFVVALMRVFLLYLLGTFCRWPHVAVVRYVNVPVGGGEGAADAEGAGGLGHPGSSVPFSREGAFIAAGMPYMVRRDTSAASGAVGASRHACMRSGRLASARASARKLRFHRQPLKCRQSCCDVYTVELS